MKILLTTPIDHGIQMDVSNACISVINGDKKIFANDDRVEMIKKLMRTPWLSISEFCTEALDRHYNIQVTWRDNGKN